MFNADAQKPPADGKEPQAHFAYPMHPRFPLPLPRRMNERKRKGKNEKKAKEGTTFSDATCPDRISLPQSTHQSPNAGAGGVGKSKSSHLLPAMEITRNTLNFETEQKKRKKQATALF